MTTKCLISAIVSDKKILDQLRIYFTDQHYAFAGFHFFVEELEDMYHQGHIPDVILLDLPKSEVLAAAAQLHQDPALALIPLILILSEDSDYLPEELLNIGAADFLMKPFRAHHLKELIQKHQQTRNKWWQTFHIEGPQAREAVSDALTTFRQKQDLAVETPNTDEPEPENGFQHFKTWMYQHLSLSAERIQKLKDYTPDDIYAWVNDLEINSLEIASGIATFLHLETLHNLYDYTFAPGLIPLQFCRKNNVIPLRDRFSRLHIALSNPFQLEVIDILNRLFKSYHLIVVAPELILSMLDPEYARSQKYAEWKLSLQYAQRHRALFTHSTQSLETSPHPAVMSQPFSQDVRAPLPQEDPELVSELMSTVNPNRSEEIAAEMERRLLQAYQAYRDQKEQQEAESTSVAINHLMEGKTSEVAPIIYLVNSLIEKAALMQASDIHIEPTENEVIVRYRIDGLLKVMHRLAPRAIIRPIIARLKIMSNLDITEKRLPQDGRVHFLEFSDHSESDIDIRVSTVPLQYGEKVVMRLLDHKRSIRSLKGMGFSETALADYRQQLASPYGMILHVGPTGSGKTTTLYSALNELNSSEVNIHTIEDPIEYTVPGLNQLEVHHQIGLTFPRALRAYLRQDPDIILVGEIRDDETAHIALEAAMTGHLLLSTLHTNDAATTVTRLLEMGIKPYMLTASLLMICAQRLLRRLCSECKQAYKASPELKHSLGLPAEKSVTFYQAQGCHHCDQQGYRGRIGVFELLIPGKKTRKLMNKPDVTAEQIKLSAMHEDGMKTLFQDGLEKAMQGHISVEELTLKILSD